MTDFNDSCVNEEICENPLELLDFSDYLTPNEFIGDDLIIY